MLIFAKVLWLSKAAEAKAGSLIVSKIKECVPTLLHQYKTGRGLGTPSTSNDVEDFANFFADTLGRMVPSTTEEAFYKPQRRGSDGKPRQQDGMVAKVSAKKVKLIAYNAERSSGDVLKVLDKM